MNCPNKQRLRSQILEQRRNLPKADLMQDSFLICQEVISYLEKHPNFNQVFGYYPMPFEVDLLPILERTSMTFTFALPVIDSATKQMEFYLWAPGEPLTTSHFGTKEPIKDKSERVKPLASSTLMIVPALALSTNGDRLGFGGGFYDRYLARYPAVTRMGVVFEKFVLNRFKIEPFDMRMSLIATEKGVREV